MYNLYRVLSPGSSLSDNPWIQRSFISNFFCTETLSISGLPEDLSKNDIVFLDNVFDLPELPDNNAVVAAYCTNGDVTHQMMLNADVVFFHDEKDIPQFWPVRPAGELPFYYSVGFPWNVWSSKISTASLHGSSPQRSFSFVYNGDEAHLKTILSISNYIKSMGVEDVYTDIVADKKIKIPKDITYDKSLVRLYENLTEIDRLKVLLRSSVVVDLNIHHIDLCLVMNLLSADKPVIVEATNDFIIPDEYYDYLTFDCVSNDVVPALCSKLLYIMHNRESFTSVYQRVIDENKENKISEILLEYMNGRPNSENKDDGI